MAELPNELKKELSKLKKKRIPTLDEIKEESKELTEMEKGFEKRFFTKHGKRKKSKS